MVPGYHTAFPALGQQLPAGGDVLVAGTSQHSQQGRDGDLGSSEGEGQGADNHLLKQAEGWQQLISFGKGQLHLRKLTVTSKSANQKPHGPE